MELIDTIDMMTSADYKQRFKAEYLQTKIRYDKLHEIIVKYKAKTLEFELNSPIDVLQEQAKSMGLYLCALEIRAQIEHIELEVKA